MPNGPHHGFKQPRAVDPVLAHGRAVKLRLDHVTERGGRRTIIAGRLPLQRIRHSWPPPVGLEASDLVEALSKVFPAMRSKGWTEARPPTSSACR